MKFSSRLRDDQWQKLEWVLSQIESDPRYLVNGRLFIDGVLWVILNNTAWSHLLPEFGAWPTVYDRFKRWNQRNLWHALAQSKVDDSELQLMLKKIVDCCDLLNLDIERREQKKAARRRK